MSVNSLELPEGTVSSAGENKAFFFMGPTCPSRRPEAVPSVTRSHEKETRCTKGQRHRRNLACGIRCSRPTRVPTRPDPDGRRTPWLYMATRSGGQGTHLGEPTGSGCRVRGAVGSSGYTERPVPRPGPARTEDAASLTGVAASVPRAGLYVQLPAGDGGRADPHGAGASSPTCEVTAGDTHAAATLAHCPGPRTSCAHRTSPSCPRRPPERAATYWPLCIHLSWFQKTTDHPLNLFSRRAVSLRP